MSELKAYSVVASSEAHNYINGEINLAFEAYDADEVDALLSDKNKEIEELKQKLENVNELIKTARQMLEDAKASAYAESVDAGMENRRIHKAFYKACANWANIHVAFSSSYATKEKWRKMERKCIKKAEEYK